MIIYILYLGNAVLEMLNYHSQSKNSEKPVFLYFAPNAVHFPIQAPKRINDEIIGELVTSKLEKPSPQLDAFSVQEIIDIVQDLSMTELMYGNDPSNPG